jgi:hypothetical protein
MFKASTYRLIHLSKSASDSNRAKLQHCAPILSSSPLFALNKFLLPPPFILQGTDNLITA